MNTARFRQEIYAFYKDFRRPMPWRNTRDPYKILVSEVMLQQTQVDRVVEKYKEFIKSFPDTESLAKASAGDVLKVWQGLGYNRRALSLKKAAEEIVLKYKGKVPSHLEVLDALPGIGHATAGSIAVFAFNKPVVFIETNVRSVFLHYFFAGKEGVSDGMILPLIGKTMDAVNPREWFYALMDYGSWLKKQIPNPSRRSAHYLRQSRFEGSDRQIRGAIIRLLTRQSPISRAELYRALPFEKQRVSLIVKKLFFEGFVKKQHGFLTL